MTSSHHLPKIILLILLLAAGLTVWGGIRMGTREEVVRMETGRAELSDFGGAALKEIARLEALYESHMGDLAALPTLSNQFAIEKACDNLIGVTQFAVAHDPALAFLRYKKSIEDFQLNIEIPSGGSSSIFTPTLNAEHVVEAGRKWYLLPEHVSNDDAEAGWVQLPNKPLVFWKHRELDQFVVLTVDRSQVAEAMNGALKEWANASFDPVKVTGVNASLAGDSGTLTSIGDDASLNPDWIVPLQSRFGTWKLAAKDPRQSHTSYHQPTLVVAATVALLLAITGFAAFFFGTRAIRFAEQRVSFVNRVSHELRTPLTNILLNTDLASGSLGESKEKTRKRLGIVRQEAGRLSRLISNVLTFSNSERDQLKLESAVFDAAACLRRAIDPFRPSLRRRGIEIREDIENGTMAIGDADATEQIVANLISNVEKYATEGEWLRIECAPRKDEVVITVTDNGPGIPDYAREEVFEPFRRLDSRVDEGSSGTGLGLSIARDLAERMEGSIALEPSDRGAHFCLRLPRAAGDVVPITGSAEAS